MALATTDEVLELLPSLTADPGELGTFITRAEEALALACYWPGVGGAAPKLEQQTRTLFLDGGSVDLEHADVLHLPIRPVVSIASVHVDANRVYGSSDELVEDTDFELDETGGRLVIKAASTKSWSSGFEAIKVVGVFGLTTGSIPEFVKQAVAVVVKHNWEGRSRRGTDQTTSGGDSKTYTNQPLLVPPEARVLVSGLTLWERAMSGGPYVRYAA